VLATVKQLFRFGEGRGYIHHSPAYALDRKDLGVVANVRERYLDAEEIRIFWHAINRAPRLSEQSRVGFRILLLTGVRVGELLQAKWEHVDLDKGEWFIPEENSKTRAWTVPLVPAVKRLFKELQGLDDVYVMAGKVRGTHMSDKALSRALARLFTLGDGDPLLPVEKFTLHDFRRTLRTHADDLEIEPHIAEKCLNHSLGHIEKTYNKNTLLNQRRKALQKWANYVDLVVTERDNVEVLRRG
jgi:integrase